MNRSSKRWTLWLFVAFSFLGFGGWQALRIATGQKAMGSKPKHAGPPVKVRSDGRKAMARDQAMKDPVGAYFARAKRGMTDREIRWLAEDFQKAGLEGDLPDGSAPETYNRMRVNQQHWYLAALAEGFGLTSAQTKIAAERLRRLADEDYRQAVKNPWLRDLFPTGIQGKSPDLDMVVYPSHWLLDGSEVYAPWKLCDLSREQTSLTMLGWLENHRREQALQTSAFPDDFSGAWVRYGASRMVLDPVSHLPTDPGKESYAGTLDILPNTADQKLSPGDFNELEAARKSQPAQLRLALLVNSELAGKLLEQLDSPQPPIATPPQSTPDSSR